MSVSLTAQQFELTGQIYMNLQRSAMAYKEYLNGGRTFMFAKILRIYNEKIKELILTKGYILPENLQKDALDLVSHYDIWMQKWDDLKEKLDPSLNDEFVFPNSITFPKEAARNLEKEYKKLKQLTIDAE